MNQFDAMGLAVDLLAHYHLTDWRFKFDRSVRRFGYCDYQARTISLSFPLTERNDRPQVENTIRHEIAHALAGSMAGHGPTWRWIAQAIGCDGNRLYSHANVNAVEHKSIGTCPNCGHVYKRHRAKGIACGKCCRTFNNGRYDAKYKVVWQRATTGIENKGE